MIIIDTIITSEIKKMSPQLVVADIDDSIEFYTRNPGFEIDMRYEDFYAGISRDGWSIHLKKGKALIEERKNNRINEDLDIVFSFDGIENLQQECLTRAGEFIQSLRNMPYGKEFYIADPDGYIIAFLEEA